MIPGITAGQMRQAVAPPSAFRVWRVTVTDSLSSDSFKALIAEMVLLSAAGLPLSMAGVAASSSTYGGAFGPDAAFDGNPSTGWSSADLAPLPQWLQITLPTAVEAKGLRLSSGDNSTRAARMPTAFTLEAASTDGAALITKTSASGLAAWGVSETRDFTFS